MRKSDFDLALQMLTDKDERIHKLEEALKPFAAMLRTDGNVAWDAVLKAREVLKKKA